MKLKPILSSASSLVLFLAVGLSARAQGKVGPANSPETVNESVASVANNASSNLVAAAQASKSSSEQLLKTQEEELQQATAQLEQLRQLAAEGLVARNEVMDAEQKLAFMHGKVNGTRQQITESDQLISGLLKQEEIKKQQAAAAAVTTKYRSLTTPTILRYSGSAAWSISYLSQVQTFFTSTFNRPLPVSTIGQSATHNRLGWDHRNAVDVGLHPDTAEGKALIGYLQSQGIPFLAFRSAVPGVSTGPHIHIGTPSHRLS